MSYSFFDKLRAFFKLITASLTPVDLVPAFAGLNDDRNDLCTFLLVLKPFPSEIFCRLSEEVAFSGMLAFLSALYLSERD